jgi:hypothetical protein
MNKIEYVNLNQNWQNLPFHLTILRGLKPRSNILKNADKKTIHYPNPPEFLKNELNNTDGTVLMEILSVITIEQLEGTTTETINRNMERQTQNVERKTLNIEPETSNPEPLKKKGPPKSNTQKSTGKKQKKN